MIIVKLTPGLGNNFFQYALGRHLAIKNKTTLKVDLSGLIGIQLSDYNDKLTLNDKVLLFENTLGRYNVVCEIARPEEVKRLRGWGDESFFYNKLIGRVRRKLKITPRSYIRERVIHQFQREVLEAGDNVYLDGTWINPRYFEGIADVIRKDLSLKHDQQGIDKEIAEMIRSTNSVSVHFRRGDYQDHPVARRIYSTYGLDYYFKAVEIILSKVSKPHFFIFSDEPEWVKKNFSIKGDVTYVTHNPIEKGYEDLRLMSQCKHNIIANSTFSWWAAWLNDNPEKLVIAPKKWRNDDIDTSDLLLPGWICI